MITRDECMATVLREFPRFAAAWQRHEEYWGRDPRGLCSDLAAFADFVGDDLRDGGPDPPRAFVLVEQLLGEGDEEVKNAAATCFFEAIVHRVPHDLSGNAVMRHLGLLSRQYVAAWDAFTGVKTK